LSSPPTRCLGDKACGLLAELGFYLPSRFPPCHRLNLPKKSMARLGWSLLRCLAGRWGRVIAFLNLGACFLLLLSPELWFFPCLALSFSLSWIAGMVAHEVGHVILLPPEFKGRFYFLLSPTSLILVTPPLSPQRSLMVAMAGPAVSLLLSSIFFIASHWFNGLAKFSLLGEVLAFFQEFFPFFLGERTAGPS